MIDALYICTPDRDVMISFSSGIPLSWIGDQITRLEALGIEFILEYIID